MKRKEQSTMSIRKTLDQKIAEAHEKIKQEQNRMKELQQKQKHMQNKERTHRLCRRMGILESMMPDIITLTEEQFYTFLEKVVANDFGRRMLTTIITKGEASPPSTDETPQPEPAADESADSTAEVPQAEEAAQSED
jgi:hypothetical protein